MSDDDDLRQHLAAQPRPRPAAGLAARIVQHATAQPQHQPWYRRVQRALEQWRYGWPVKVASLALCGVLGVMAGQWSQPAGDADIQVAAEVMGTLLGVDEQ
ncbi:MAG: hypothetical protein AAGC84_18075 [Pseudomonas sp.]